MTNTWHEYYQNTKNNPPSKLLKEAVAFVSTPGTALDLGAGALVDSKYLLSLGFEVMALDKEKTSEEIVDDKFKFVQSLFIDYNFPKNTFDLVNAQFSLPFNGPETFPLVWKNIVASLKPKGIFAGQLFGLDDEWHKLGRKLAFHSKDEVVKFLADFEIIKLEEINKDGKLANGSPKHWHFFNIVAQRR